MGRDGGQFYQEFLPSPPGGWIQPNDGVWWGRENYLVSSLEKEICPRLVLDWASTNRLILEFSKRRCVIAWWLRFLTPTPETLVRILAEAKFILSSRNKIGV